MRRMTAQRPVAMHCANPLGRKTFAQLSLLQSLGKEPKYAHDEAGDVFQSLHKACPRDSVRAPAAQAAPPRAEPSSRASTPGALPACSVLAASPLAPKYLLTELRGEIY